MNQMPRGDLQPDRRVIEHHYHTCCWPNGGRPGRLFWGVILVVLGGVWLAGNLIGLDDWGRWLIPVLFVAWGAGLLVGNTSDAPPPGT